MKEEHQTIGVALGGPRHETNQQQQLKSTNHVEHSRGHTVDAVELLENPGGVSRVDELVERPHQHDDEHADAEQKERQARSVSDAAFGVVCSDRLLAAISCAF